MSHTATLVCPNAENAEHDREKQIVEEVSSRLWKRGHWEARHIECSYNEEDGTLTIAGRVRSDYMRQTAQAVVQAIEGVERIVNRLEVIPSNPRRPTPRARHSATDSATAASRSTPVSGKPKPLTVWSRMAIASLSTSQIGAKASEELVELICFMQPWFCSPELLTHLPYYERSTLEKLTYLVREVCRRLTSPANEQPEDVTPDG